LKIRLLIIAILASSITLSACGGEVTALPQPAGETTSDIHSGAEPTIETQPKVKAVDPQEKGDPDRGRVVFENGGEKYPKNTVTCVKCHSLDGSEGKYGPSMTGISERAGERVPGLSAEEYLRQSILEPNALIVGDYPEKMVGIHAALLSDEEIEDLVAFMLTQ
jgi:mono/diheme cytochrome c family protein